MRREAEGVCESYHMFGRKDRAVKSTLSFRSTQGSDFEKLTTEHIMAKGLYPFLGGHTNSQFPSRGFSNRTLHCKQPQK